MISPGLLPLCYALSSLWVAGLWQGTVLAMLAALLLRTVAPMAQRRRYRLLLAGYTMCILLPLIEWIGTLPGTASGASHAGIAGVHPLLTVSSRWTLLCAALWGAASIWEMLRLIAGAWSIRHILRSATPMLPEQLSPYATLLQLRSRGQVALLCSEEVETAVAIGYRKPCIVVPSTLISELNEEQVEQVLRHELEHLARWDDCATLLFGLLRCIFPLCPALVWFERRLLAAREMACDDAVLRVASPHAYAANLTLIAESSIARRMPRYMPSLLGGATQFSQRIEHIVSARQEDHRRSRVQVAAASVGLLGMALLLLQSPVVVAFQAGVQAPTPHAGSNASVPARTIILPVKRRLSDTSRRKMYAAPAATHLLAMAHRRRAVVPQSTEIMPEAATMLVVWNGPGKGVCTEMVLELRPVSGFHRPMRRQFTFLEI